MNGKWKSKAKEEERKTVAKTLSRRCVSFARQKKKEKNSGVINVLFMLGAFVIQDRSRQNEYS